MCIFQMSDDSNSRPEMLDDDRRDSPRYDRVYEDDYDRERERDRRRERDRSRERDRDRSSRREERDRGDREGERWMSDEPSPTILLRGLTTGVTENDVSNLTIVKRIKKLPRPANNISIDSYLCIFSNIYIYSRCFDI